MDKAGKQVFPLEPPVEPVAECGRITGKVRLPNGRSGAANRIPDVARHRVDPENLLPQRPGGIITGACVPAPTWRSRSGSEGRSPKTRRASGCRRRGCRLREKPDDGDRCYGSSRWTAHGTGLPRGRETQTPPASATVRGLCDIALSLGTDAGIRGDPDRSGTGPDCRSRHTPSRQYSRDKDCAASPFGPTHVDDRKNPCGGLFPFSEALREDRGEI